LVWRLPYKFQFFISAFHADGFTFMKLTTQDLERQWVL
jgi:hypothetical protein